MCQTRMQSVHSSATRML